MENTDKKAQHEKEFKSFKNKFSGKNLVWFLSLRLKLQYDLFFEWKRYKYSKRDINGVIVQKRKVRNYITGSIENLNHKIYPASFKHFILRKKSTKMYYVNINKLRDTSLKLLMEKS